MKLLRTGSLMVIGLLLSTAGCAPRTRLPWVPGIYHYVSQLPGQAPVAGSIEVVADGPLNVTSNVGACDALIETTPRALRERLDGQLLGRGFICGTEHRVSVTLGRDGGPPIRGTVSNQRTVTETTFGETTCAEYQTVETGERIERVCVAWNWGPKTEKRTTGSTAQLYLVPDSLAPRP